jgi:hypothetical protein
MQCGRGFIVDNYESMIKQLNPDQRLRTLVKERTGNQRQTTLNIFDGYFQRNYIVEKGSSRA